MFINNRIFLQHDSVFIIIISNLSVISFVVLLHNILDMENKKSNRVYVSIYQISIIINFNFEFFGSNDFINYNREFFEYVIVILK